MKILVTGATGFIGAAVARQLSQQHHEVLALSRSDAAAAKLRVAGLTPVAGDFAVPASLAAPRCASGRHCQYSQHRTSRRQPGWLRQGP
jgi:nucleoside-diphosphate-sugar epimerase